MEMEEKIYTVHEVSTLYVKNKKTEWLYDHLLEAKKKWMDKEKYMEFLKRTKECVNHLNNVYRNGKELESVVYDGGDMIWVKIVTKGSNKLCLTLTVARNDAYTDVMQDLPDTENER